MAATTLTIRVEHNGSPEIIDAAEAFLQYYQECAIEGGALFYRGVAVNQDDEGNPYVTFNGYRVTFNDTDL